jgi:predicted O-methyltransferase YrrM
MNHLVRVIDEHLTDPRDGAEIGVSQGHTSMLLLHKYPALRLYMVDAWTTYDKGHPYRKSGDGHARLTQAQQDDHYLDAMRNTDFARDRRVVLRHTSRVAARSIPYASLDFCIIDGDHTYGGVLGDVAAYWTKVKPGGLMLGHDIDHPRDRRGLWGVRRAVTEFFGEGQFGVRGDVWFVAKER